MLTESQWLGCKSIDSLMILETKLMLKDGELLHDLERYCRLVGKLNYQTITGTDISYLVSVMSQFIPVPRTTHWDVVVRILRYLKGSPGRGLIYSNQGHNRITGFTGVDWVCCPTSQRSTTRFCIFFGDNLVSWKSKKQTIIAQSSANSKYHAMANISCELVWTNLLLNKLSVVHYGLMRLHYDN